MNLNLPKISYCRLHIIPVCRINGPEAKISSLKYPLRCLTLALLITILFTPIITRANDDYDSTNFTVRDPAFSLEGGESTSTSYQNNSSTSQTVTGESTSTNFIHQAGHIYLTEPNETPNAPTSGFSPHNATTTKPVTISWSHATDPNSTDTSTTLRYTIQLGETSNPAGSYLCSYTVGPFSSGNPSAAITSCTLENKKYYYVIKTIDDEDVESSWSDVKWFTIVSVGGGSSGRGLSLVNSGEGESEGEEGEGESEGEGEGKEKPPLGEKENKEKEPKGKDGEKEKPLTRADLIGEQQYKEELRRAAEKTPSAPAPKVIKVYPIVEKEEVEGAYRELAEKEISPEEAISIKEEEEEKIEEEIKVEEELKKETELFEGSKATGKVEGEEFEGMVGGAEIAEETEKEAQKRIKKEKTVEKIKAAIETEKLELIPPLLTETNGKKVREEEIQAKAKITKERLRELGIIEEAEEKPAAIEAQKAGVIFLKGITLPFALVRLYLYSEPKIYETFADENGEWEMEIASSEMEKGEHLVYAETEFEGQKSELTPIARIEVKDGILTEKILILIITVMAVSIGVLLSKKQRRVKKKKLW